MSKVKQVEEGNSEDLSFLGGDWYQVHYHHSFEHKAKRGMPPGMMLPVWNI